MNAPLLINQFPILSGQKALARQAVLVALGVVALTISAKVQIPVWPSPVPVTLGTFSVLTIGTIYGARLGLFTILTYLVLGLCGAAVFAGERAGLTYMMGGTGGYLVGYVIATAIVGATARYEFDRNPLKYATMLIVANAAIYVPGLLWLRRFAESWAQTFEWGITPFLIGDGLKLLVAAMIIPGLWSVVTLLTSEK